MRDAARTAALWAAIVALVAVVVVAFVWGGLGESVLAFLGGGSLILGAGPIGRRSTTRRPLPDVGPVDDAADDAVDDALAEAALGMEEAEHDADDVRSGAGPGVDADDEWMRDAIGAHEWRPPGRPIDPRADTLDD